MKAIHALPLALAAIASQVIAQEMPEFKPLSLEQIRANIAAQQAKERPTNPPPIIVPSSTNENTADRMRREHAEKQASQQRELDPRLEDISKAIRSSITVPLTAPGTDEVRPHPTKPNVVLVPTWMIDYQPPHVAKLAEKPTPPPSRLGVRYFNLPDGIKVPLVELPPPQPPPKPAPKPLPLEEAAKQLAISSYPYRNVRKFTRTHWALIHSDCTRSAYAAHDRGETTLADLFLWLRAVDAVMEKKYGQKPAAQPQQSSIEMRLEMIQRSLDDIEANQ